MGTCLPGGTLCLDWRSRGQTFHDAPAPRRGRGGDYLPPAHSRFPTYRIRAHASPRTHYAHARTLCLPPSWSVSHTTSLSIYELRRAACGGQEDGRLAAWARGLCTSRSASPSTCLLPAVPPACLPTLGHSYPILYMPFLWDSYSHYDFLRRLSAGRWTWSDICRLPSPLPNSARSAHMVGVGRELAPAPGGTDTAMPPFGPSLYRCPPTATPPLLTPLITSSCLNLGLPACHLTCTLGLTRLLPLPACTALPSQLPSWHGIPGTELAW